MANQNEKSELVLGIDIGMTHITATYYKKEELKHKSIKPKASNKQYEKIKAFIGRRFDDPKLDDLPLNYHFNYTRWDPVEDKITKSSENLNVCDNVKLISDNEVMDPIEPMIDLISELKERIELKLRSRLDYVTISIPVRFDNNQKNKMILACKLSGFENIRVITEPSAVAISYAYDLKKSNRFDNECIMVVDMGAYFVDVGIFEINRIDGKDFLNVLALDGECVGGCEFDELIVEFCIKKLKDLGFDENIDENETLLLFKACEKARKKLGKIDETEIKIGLFKKDKDFNLKITLDEYNDMCKDLFKKIMDRIKGTLILMRRMKPYYSEDGFYKTNSLDEAFMDIQKEEINKVILSGKFSKTKKIQELISEYFGPKKICIDYIKGSAVSAGAAYHAKMNIQDKNNENAQSLIFEDAIPYPFNMISHLGTTTGIFRKNEFYPTSRLIAIETETAYQTEMMFKIIEGDDDNSIANLVLKECSFKGIPPAPRGTYRVNFCFVLDYNGLLSIFLVNHETNEHDIFFMSNPIGKMSEYELDRIKESIVFRRERRKKNFLRTKIDEKIYKISEDIKESETDVEQRKIDLDNIAEIQEFLNSSEIIKLSDYKSYKRRLSAIKNNYKKSKDESKETEDSSEDTSSEVDEETIKETEEEINKCEIMTKATTKTETVSRVEKKEEPKEKDIVEGKIKESKKDRVFKGSKDETVNKIKQQEEKHEDVDKKELQENTDKKKEDDEKQKEISKEKPDDKKKDEEKNVEKENTDKKKEGDEEEKKERKLTADEIEEEERAKAYLEKKDSNKKCY